MCIHRTRCPPGATAWREPSDRDRSRDRSVPGHARTPDPARSRFFGTLPLRSVRTYWHTFVVHTADWQSVLKPHMFPVAQREQAPPQSVSVSLPFLTPSAHEGALHTLLLHVPLQTFRQAPQFCQSVVMLVSHPLEGFLSQSAKPGGHIPESDATSVPASAPEDSQTYAVCCISLGSSVLSLFKSSPVSTRMPPKAQYAPEPSGVTDTSEFRPAEPWEPVGPCGPVNPAAPASPGAPLQTKEVIKTSPLCKAPSRLLSNPD